MKADSDSSLSQYMMEIETKDHSLVSTYAFFHIEGNEIYTDSDEESDEEEYNQQLSSSRARLAVRYFFSDYYSNYCVKGITRLLSMYTDNSFWIQEGLVKIETFLKYPLISEKLTFRQVIEHAMFGSVDAQGKKYKGKGTKQFLKSYGISFHEIKKPSDISDAFLRHCAEKIFDSRAKPALAQGYGRT
jgi:hypothetical protein